MNAIDFPDHILEEMWKRTDWKKAEERLSDQQEELSRMALMHKHDEILSLQKEIVETLDNKMLAVRHVVKENSTPGIDNVKWTTEADMMRAAFSLNKDNYQAQPLKRIRIEARMNRKERYADIPTSLDRAMSILYGYSLIPVTEAIAEKKSFGFRQGRSCHDAHGYILEAMKKKDAPEWVVCLDIESFYASIQHKWLMQHLPMDKDILAQFLSVGIVDSGELFPDDGFGISEASNISPYIGNFILDGLQKYIYSGLHGKTKDIDYENGNLVRFADDMVIFARSHEDATKILSIVHAFMFERGLHLSFGKCGILTVYEGFNFLSRTFINRNGVICSFPSQQAVDRFKAEIHEYILNFQSSQRELINGLNRKLQGWANYHRYSDAEEAFKTIDNAVQAALLEAAQRKHPKMNLKKLVDKYWYTEADGTHVYALPEEKGVQVIRLSNVVILQHRKININANPYLDRDYLEERSHDREIYNVTGKYKSIWKRQNGKCFYCGKKILRDQWKTVIQINPCLKPSLNNSAYVHKICSRSTFETIHTMQDIDTMTEFDVMSTLSLLKAYSSNEKIYDRIMKPEWRYYKLKRYFAKTCRSSITLTFSELEHAMGRKLTKNLRNNRCAWYPRKETATIAYAWLSEGYQIKKLDLKKETISFHSTQSGVSRLDIPKELTENKIPDDARVELEWFMKYIVKKYGLAKNKGLF